MFTAKSWLVAFVGVLVGAAIGVGIMSFGGSGKPSSHKDQISYAIGAQFGKSLKAQDLELDAKSLSHGIDDGLTKEKLALSEDEMQSAMTKLNEDRQKQMRELAEKNKGSADDFLARNRVAEGVKSTASGLQYKILDEGKGPSPKGDDIVVVNYRGTLVDGKEFDSSTRRNTPAEFPLKGVIPGWTEGLQLMKKGGKATFYIPPELAYGDHARQSIPPNSVLIFDVELLDVKPAGSVPDKSPSAHNHPPSGKKK